MSGTIGLIHGELRWLFLLAALVGVGRAAIALARSSEFGRADRIIRAVYNGLLDLQALYGIGLTVYLLVKFGFDVLWPRRILHPLIMLAAVVVAHGVRRLGGEGDRGQHRAQLIGYVASFAIIFAGVLVVQRGWMG
jgi:hypothetical protein